MIPARVTTLRYNDLQRGPPRRSDRMVLYFLCSFHYRCLDASLNLRSLRTYALEAGVGSSLSHGDRCTVWMEDDQEGEFSSIG